VQNPISKTAPASLLRDVEDLLGEQPMFGVAIGSLLNDVVVIDLINGQGKWSTARRLGWAVRRCLMRRRRAFRPVPPAASNDSILVTWRSSSPRIDGLLKPVIEELGAERCTVLYEKQSVAAHAPRGAALLRLFEVVPHDPEIWLPEFRRCWPAWRAALKGVCRQYGLSATVYERLAIELVYGSQVLSGFRQLLQNLRPAAIVTEYDRSTRWSCLVLAARSLGIPTFTLQHGVLDEQGVGYVPVVADKIFCWGEISRDVLLNCDVSPERILLGGCPRLTRDFEVGRAEGRRKLGLDPNQPMVMLGTAPYAESVRRQLVEVFCQGMKTIDGISGVVRLHASEKLQSYANEIERHPGITFCDNHRLPLEDALAAADFVAVHSSGLGSDALVKRRLVIVIDLPPFDLGHGRDLVKYGGCPQVATPGELADELKLMLNNDTVRQGRASSAEHFVQRFCSYFGRESAKRIADTVLQASIKVTCKNTLEPQRA
jgi:hypothetical protein